MQVEQGEFHLSIPLLYLLDSTITLFRLTPLNPLWADSPSSNRKEYALPLSVIRRKLSKYRFPTM